MDIGCSTGLSTLKLQSTFPEAEILGLDLSPHMLAVAKYNLRTRPEQAQVRLRVPLFQKKEVNPVFAFRSMKPSMREPWDFRP